MFLIEPILWLILWQKQNIFMSNLSLPSNDAKPGWKIELNAGKQPV